MKMCIRLDNGGDIPYVAGMSEDIRCVCRKFNIRVVFKSGRTLYIGETKQRIETRLKEHQDACKRGMMGKSAVVEHARENHHGRRPPHWTVAGDRSCW